VDVRAKPSSSLTNAANQQRQRMHRISDRADHGACVAQASPSAK